MTRPAPGVGAHKRASANPAELAIKGSLDVRDADLQSQGLFMIGLTQTVSLPAPTY